MKWKKTLGGILLALPFLALFFITWRMRGLLETLIGFLCLGVLFVYVAFAMYLFTGEDE